MTVLQAPVETWHIDPAEARVRVEETLREIAMDAIRECTVAASDETSRTWLLSVVRDPVAVATTAALAVLDGELQRAYRGAPDDLLDCLRRAPRWTEIAKG